MTHRWVLLALLSAAPALAAEPPVPTLYTNEDLDRIHPYRAQTGVTSTPACDPSEKQTDARDGARSRRAARDADREETYWRREARRHRLQVRRLERRAAALRREIERRRKESGSSRARAQSGSPRETLADVEAEIAELEAEFEERARRAGALPGWLR
jgi:predicted RNase H-like nuclease (RuvC/YqgF family)